MNSMLRRKKIKQSKKEEKVVNKAKDELSKTLTGEFVKQLQEKVKSLECNYENLMGNHNRLKEEYEELEIEHEKLNLDVGKIVHIKNDKIESLEKDKYNLEKRYEQTLIDNCTLAEKNIYLINDIELYRYKVKNYEIYALYALYTFFIIIFIFIFIMLYLINGY